MRNRIIDEYVYPLVLPFIEFLHKNGIHFLSVFSLPVILVLLISIHSYSKKKKNSNYYAMLVVLAVIILVAIFSQIEMSLGKI
jgi:FtsH-binding integral membrane protein